MMFVMRKLTLLTFLFLLSILGGCGSQQSDVEQWPLQKHCNLHKETCSVEHNQQLVTLKISPQPIPIARPLGIEVELANMEVQQMEIDISGVNMYMGYNRVPLKTYRPNYWVGTSMLAFCTQEKMEWQVTLLITLKNGKQIQIPYQLITDRG